MPLVHECVLNEARALASQNDDWSFRLVELVRRLPHLNPATVRTHVASRCCVNAPANHQSRHRYFRALDRGLYRIEPAFRSHPKTPRAWQDRIIDSLDSGVDPTQLTRALARTPTERLEAMRRAAVSMAAMRR